ncbi:MAG: PDZ domain-containing protein [Bdellovibrio bacteriovorus]
MDSWRAAEARIADLQSRLARVEQALAERVQAEVSEPPQAPQGSEERRDTLVAAGVNPELAEDIVWRESRIELERLNLRDQASREGWLGSDRYRAALDALANEGVSLREEIGDAAWDRFLYLTGEDNRVGVSSVIPGSAAEAAGLQPGDVIESYAGGQPFGFNDLRRATTEGEKGELVAVRIRRGDRVFDAWVPRGPLGIRLDMTRAEPLE